MRRKISSLILVAILFFSGPRLVLAENTAETSGSAASPLSLKEKLEQRLELRKQNIKEHKEQVKAKLTERVRNRVQTVAQNITHRLERRIARLEEFAVHLEELADKFEAKGADVVEARVKVDEAKNYLSIARTDLDLVDVQLDQLLTSEDPRADYEEFKSAVRTVRDDLQAARKALVEAVSLLKAQKGQLQRGENVE
jgi:hypothetical protein